MNARTIYARSRNLSWIAASRGESRALDELEAATRLPCKSPGRLMKSVLARKVRSMQCGRTYEIALALKVHAQTFDRLRAERLRTDLGLMAQ
jgi:hypothetical protein